MTINFKDQRVLVTGGTRGIGYEIAKQFLDADAQVVVTGTSMHKTENIDTRLYYEQLVIDKEQDWQESVKKIVDSYDGFDILINNAGINKVNKIFETNVQDIEEILLTNLTAPIFIVAEVSKKMKERKKGYIVNIGSIFGVVSKTGRNPYTASKAGLIGVTKTMAIDLGEDNVLVNCISPGFVDTQLTRAVLGEKAMSEISSSIPMKRLAGVSDIAPTVLFMCSKYNSYITGQNIIVDGGFTLE
ncbi:SDR family NAD(P)-dependent oxidoreductase [Sulfurimonas sp.]|uniref:SDR family NAD(P)-dependent oxidoreductase n=1 Tax=Sulfurimonas sp. TaxID=2022749 RepID=UPI003D12F294